MMISGDGDSAQQRRHPFGKNAILLHCHQGEGHFARRHHKDLRAARKHHHCLAADSRTIFVAKTIAKGLLWTHQRDFSTSQKVQNIVLQRSWSNPSRVIIARSDVHSSVRGVLSRSRFCGCVFAKWTTVSFYFGTNDTMRTFKKCEDQLRVVFLSHTSVSVRWKRIELLRTMQYCFANGKPTKTKYKLLQ